MKNTSFLFCLDRHFRIRSTINDALDVERKAKNAPNSNVSHPCILFLVGRVVHDLNVIDVVIAVGAAVVHCC